MVLSETAMSRVYTLEREQWLPRPLATTFAFFADAGNLEALTPRSLHFEIRTPRPIVMRAGLQIDYTIRFFGFPMHWRTLIEIWEPEQRFVDVQLKGPYKSWRHEHRFKAEDGGTRILDRVDYQLYGGPLAPLIHVSLVGRQLKSIFDYRQERMKALHA